MTIHWKAVKQYFTVVLLYFNFTQFVNLSVLDLVLSGVKGLIGFLSGWHLCTQT